MLAAFHRRAAYCTSHLLAHAFSSVRLQLFLWELGVGQSVQLQLLTAGHCALINNNEWLTSNGFNQSCKISTPPCRNTLAATLQPMGGPLPQTSSVAPPHASRSATETRTTQCLPVGHVHGNRQMRIVHAVIGSANFGRACHKYTDIGCGYVISKQPKMHNILCLGILSGVA